MRVVPDPPQEVGDDAAVLLALDHVAGLDQLGQLVADVALVLAQVTGGVGRAADLAQRVELADGGQLLLAALQPGPGLQR